MKLPTALFIAAMCATPTLAQDVSEGQDIYETYCAACHGIDADGRGPMSGIMTIQPTNLKRLTAENDGIFPAERVVRRIDGRDPLVAHGSPMPVFGDFFEGEFSSMQLPNGMPVLASTPVIDLTSYILAIQE